MKQIVTGVLLTLILLTGIYFSARNSVLRHVAEQRIDRIEQRYGLHIAWSQLHLTGLCTLHLQDLTVAPQLGDTLLSLHRADIRLGVWSLLTGHIYIRRVEMDSLAVDFIKRDSTANYDFLLNSSDKPDTVRTASQPETVDFSRNIHALLRLVFGLLPGECNLKALSFTQRQDGHYVTAQIPQFDITDHRFQSNILLDEDGAQQQWAVAGELNPSARRIQATIRATGNQPLKVPYINRHYGAQIEFDSLSYSFVQAKDSRDAVQLIGQATLNGLSIYHSRLSPEQVQLAQGSLDFQLNLTPRVIELDSASTLRFNTLQLHPYLRIERLPSEIETPWHVTASLHKEWFPSQELFGSLPKGLFQHLEGLQTEGDLAYRFLLDVDFSCLDSLKLESALDSRGFRIVRYGKTNLTKMSGEFEYTAYENGVAVRSYPVGPAWEHFTPLDNVSPILRMSVLQSEDGAFFSHRGFLPDAMREALIHDLRLHRFARGGSTISMQLVKNVFLNRNKNIARKLEEALIVWLIETRHLTSKERMFEVYLNIAEWGPNIYGIGEAAEFYFAKRPSQLTIEESIFLASIIPKPKHFRNSFTEDGQLRENLAGFFRLIAERLVVKGIITEAQAAAVQTDNLKLTGPAKEYFTSAAQPS